MALVDDVGQEFDYARKKAAQREGANLQAQKDALLRRQAQLGGGPSGAFIKAEQNASDASAQRLNDVNEGIDTAQRGEMRRIREVEGGRDFSRSEREASQAFARGERLGSQDWQGQQAGVQRDWQSGEAGKQRNWATGEREAGQVFATGERLGAQDFQGKMATEQRTWATGEREAGQAWQSGEAAVARDWQSDENTTARNLQNSQFMKQLDLASRQFEHEITVDDFNMEMANKIFEEKDLFDRILNPSGGDVPGGTIGSIADVATGGIYGKVATGISSRWG